MATWWDILAASLSGGGVVKLLDHFYDEYKRRSFASKSAGDLVNKHLDPILKAGDELVGKILSLAQTDFEEIKKNSFQDPNNVSSAMPYLEVVYLFSHFWARVQILRYESLFVNLSADKKGKQLMMFFSALEAKKTRIVDRAWQRGIGESLIKHNRTEMRAMTYFEFMNKFLSTEKYREWFDPVILTLKHVNAPDPRQRILVYGSILHALINTLDSKHLVTRERPGWGNKLTRKSRKALQFRVFGVYLQFVKNPELYYSVGGKVR